MLEFYVFEDKSEEWFRNMFVPDGDPIKSDTHICPPDVTVVWWGPWSSDRCAQAIVVCRKPENWVHCGL